MTGFVFSWPARLDGTLPPAFPEDCFYQADYGNKARMAFLVQDLVNKMRFEPAVLSAFLTDPADENLQGKSNFNQFPIPALPPVTIGNHESIFEYLVRVYLSKLSVLWFQADTVAPDSNAIFAPKVEGVHFFDFHAQTCAEAKQMVHDEKFQAYLSGNIGVLEFVEGNPDTSDFYKFRAGLEIFRGRFNLNLSGVEGTFRPHLMLIPQAGTPMNLPPEVNAIGTFIAGPSTAAGINWFSQIYSPAAFQFSLPCPSPGQQLDHEWALINIVTVKPNFRYVITEPFGPCKPCNTCTDESCPAGADKYNLNSIDIEISLGRTSEGSAGLLSIKADTPSTLLASPAALLRTLSEGVVLIPDTTRLSSTGVPAPRQILAPQALVDVVALDIFSYELRFYSRDNVGSRGTDGLYQTAGSPYRTLRIENPDRSTSTFNRLRVSDPGDASKPPTLYVYTAATNTWALTQGSGSALSTETHSVRVDGPTGDRIETHSVLNADGQETFREEKTYRAFPWNIPTIAERSHELTRHVVDPAGAALATTYTYYTDPAVDGANYGRLRRRLEPSGNWTEYTYDTSGRVVTTKRPFHQAPVGATTNVFITATTFSTVAPQETEVTSVIDAAGATFEVSRRFRAFVSGEVRDITAQTAGAAWNAADNLVTTTRYYSSGVFRGDLASVRAPDGTLTTYGYQTVVDGKITTVATGASNAAGTAVVDGTRTVTKVNTAGSVVSEERYDIGSGLLMDLRLATTVDNHGRVTRADYADGTFETKVYGCCTLESETDRQGVVTSYSYDSRRRRISSTRAGVTQRSTLDPQGRELTATRIGSDASEILQQTNVYDRAGRLTSTKDARNRTTTFNEMVDVAGLVVRTTTFPDLGTRIERFYPDGSIASIAGTAAVPRKSIYGVDAGGLFTQEISVGSAGEETEWTKSYKDLAGRNYKTVSAAGATAQTFFNPAGQSIKQVDPDGVVTLLQYNTKGELEFSVLDMDRNGAIDLSGTDRIVRTQRLVTSSNGTVISRTTTSVWINPGAPDNQVLSIEERSTNGRQHWQTQAGLTTHTAIALDGIGGRTETVTRPDGTQQVSTYTLDRLMSVETKHAIMGRLSLVTYAYDFHGRPRTATDAATGATTYSYFDDDQFQSISTPDPDPTKTGDGYDAQVTAYGYDTAGRQNKVTLPDSGVVDTTYYPTGQVKRTWGARTYPQEYTYDAQGRVKTLTTWQNFAADSGKAVTTWSYHPQSGHLSGKTHADGQGPTYTYTPAGRLKTRTWARGITATYSYNNAAELSAVDYSDTTVDVALVYDRLGRLATRNDGAGTSTFAYEGLTSLISSETHSAGILAGVQVTRSYDALQRPSVLSVTPAAIGYATTYGYDAASRLQTVAFGPNVSTYAYHSDSPLVQSITFASGGTSRLNTTKTYDALNRLSSVSNISAVASQARSVTYLHNSANQRTRATREDGSYWSYGYDSLGQVTMDKKFLADGTTRLGHDFGYQYDTIGNRTTAGATGKARTYTANTLNQYSAITASATYDMLATAHVDATVTVNNQPTQRQGEFFLWEKTVNNTSASLFEVLTIVGVRNNVGPNGEDAVASQTRQAFVPQTPEALLYDTDGNLTLDARWSYVWDGENRMIAMETNPTAVLAGVPKQKLEFVYDGQSRRVAKKVSNWNGTAWTIASHTSFAYDGWNLIAELNALSANAVVRTYVWGTDLSGTAQGGGGVGGLLAMTHSPTSSTHAVAHDGNGNIIGLVNAADASMSANYDYNAFGETTLIQGSAAGFNPFRFSTKYTDEETGLVYYGLRYYSPSTGRWISRDPLEEQGGTNLYGACLNDPVNKWDILGQNTEDSDSLALKAFALVLKGGCFWQCFLLGMTNEDIESLMREIQNDLPGANKTIFQAWLENQAQEAPQRFLALLVELQKPVRIVQGQGLVGSTLAKALGERVYPALRKEIAKKTVRWVGKGGAKVFGRIGSKALPVIGQVLLVAEGVNACRCLAVCRDGKFTEDETWLGLLGFLD